MNLGSGTGKLLNLLQSGFPFVSQPFEDLGEQLDISGDEVIRQIGKLKSEDIIRQIGPLFEARKLGFRTTLVATRVTGEEYRKAGQVLIDHPGVSHAYERNHHFNLWFTLALQSTVDVNDELEKMFASVDTEAIFSLPATKLFKLRTYFDTSGESQPAIDNSHDVELSQQECEISPADKGVINTLQQDLPLVPRPFYNMSEELGMNESEFLSRCQSLLSQGIIRRFSPSINHRRVGFTANGMACWAVPEEAVDDIGRKLASLREVSHCYERQTNPLWKYNLFAMIHGLAEEECRKIADTVAGETGLTDYMLLFSTRELKKTRVKYLV
ncbi:MAG: hypothetical protein V3S02_03665 [Dehalococcoidales bacterium]